MRIQVVLLASMLCAGCGAPSLALAPPIEEPSVRAAAVDGVAQVQPRRDPSRVLVLQTTKLDRYAEVLGPVDVHEPMGGDAAALARLREKAAEMGADAVVGVEFHHGEAEGEPTHLSGLAVRFVAPPALPMH